MPPEEADPGRLLHILDAATEVVNFTTGKTLDAYRNDRMLQLAIERLLGIIGEAANKLSRQFRDANPQMPWTDIIRSRHIMVHDYDKVDHDRVWRIATVHVPVLVEQLHILLPPPPHDPLPEDHG